MLVTKRVTVCQTTVACCITVIQSPPQACSQEAPLLSKEKPYFCRERILDTSRDSTSKCRLALRGGSNEEKKDYALGMNLMRSQVLYWAAQGLRGIKFTSACPIVPPISSSLQCISAIVLQVSTFLDDVLQGYDCVHMQYLHYSFSHCPLATVLCSPRSCSIERLQL